MIIWMTLKNKNQEAASQHSVLDCLEERENKHLKYKFRSISNVLGTYYLHYLFD